MENIDERKGKLACDLIDFIDASPSPFHVVMNIKEALIKQGFQELMPGNKWQIKLGEKYFVSKNQTALVAFVAGTGKPENDGFRIIAAHSDSPGLKIKPVPGIRKNKNYYGLNTEVYGGPILSTWFDRPLSIAGRVSVESDNSINPESHYINLKKPLCLIPNLAIHFNREVNEGFKIERQKMLFPVFSLSGKNLNESELLFSLIASELNIEPSKILDYDLHLFDVNQGCIMGNYGEFISSAKLDNLAMVHAGVEALTNSQPCKATQLFVCFDNEEVGSLSKQGAGSPFLRNIIHRICNQYNPDTEAFYQAIEQSFMISADMAHAVHPAFNEKYDPVTQPIINGGPVIKINANQKYTTDSDSSAVFEMLCRKAGVPVQRYVNHSDIAGGSTLGGISSAQLDLRSVDIGNPILAMHSIRELGGVDDHFYLLQAFNKFYK
jgi:aspartyl aminopeptidase